MKYKIAEIFYSIQGEGYHAGTAASFIRFAGCNLSCGFCDTDHRVKLILSAKEIIAYIKNNKSKVVILTGGEPTLQIDNDLVDRLRGYRKKIHIETNGTNKVISGIDWITVSPKTESFNQTHGNELKLVYTGQDLKYYEQFDFDHFYLQPESGKNTKEVIETIKGNPKWRLSIQTQKLLKIR